MSNAKECQDKYNMDISYEEITDCDGCKSETERIFSGCGNCKIRIYTKDKKLENCAYCSDFPCSDLENLFLYEAAAKLELEKIRSNMFFLK